MEVNSYVDSSRSERASANRMQKNLQNFASRPRSSQRTRIYEAASIWHPVGAGTSYKTIPDVDDGFGNFTPVCRECTLRRADPRSRVFGEIRGGTVIGKVVAFLVVQFPGTYGIDIEIPSPNRPELTSWVLICQGKDRFVGEKHHSRSRTYLASWELLTEESSAEEDEPWFTEKKQSYIEETRAERVRNLPDPSVVREKHPSCKGEEVEKVFLLIHRSKEQRSQQICDDIGAQ